MSEESSLGTAPFFRATTPDVEEIRDYVTREFVRLRKRQPDRVEVVTAPGEVGVIVYLQEVTEEDRALVSELERRLVEAGEPASAVAWPTKRQVTARPTR